MNESQATTLMIALFALRCVIPLALTLAIGYTMNRIVDRWRAEDEARAAGTAVPVPAPAPSLQLPVVTVPCWLTGNCDEAARADCAAFNTPGLPCWLVRLTTEGRLPAACTDCPIYQRAMVLA